jgi:hypothetical protein
MHVEKPFFGFERPHQIPESYLLALVTYSPNDRGFISYLERVAGMISADDAFTEQDLCVFAFLLAELAVRPSTQSPIVVGMYEDTGTTTTVAAVWARNPGLQTGFMADYHTAKNKVEPVRRILAEFTVRMTYNDLVRRFRAYARAMGHDWVLIHGEPYMIVRQARSSTCAC